MIEKYASKLIENLPENILNSKLDIDLILDGGLFNGSYLIGVMYFIKSMEEKKLLNIKRISACSIGTIVALLYFCNCLEYSEYIYKLAKQNLENNHSLSILHSLKSILEKNKLSINNDFINKINNKFFITYYNIKKNKKIVKSIFKDYDDLINTISKSCFLPFIIDGNIVYNNKYIDGINPYIFSLDNNIKKKILYIELFSFDKITNILITKNENNNIYRILSGLLDIHSFFIKKGSTNMCSYINDWNILDRFRFLIKIFIEKFIIFWIVIFYKFKKYGGTKYFNFSQNNIIYKIIRIIFYDLYIILLEHYII
jgi:hypothetical protein